MKSDLFWQCMDYRIVSYLSLNFFKNCYEQATGMANTKRRVKGCKKTKQKTQKQI